MVKARGDLQVFKLEFSVKGFLHRCDKPFKGVSIEWGLIQIEEPTLELVLIYLALD
jgi:hypothetical protein